jgi:Kef-type K+ transport system membrane component KefB
MASILMVLADPGHGAPEAFVVLAIAAVLVAAKLGGELAIRVGQPAVLGELIIGVLLGNLALLQIDHQAFQAVVGFFEQIENPPSPDDLAAGNEIGSTLDMLARIGVLILLFEVGLESTVGQMLKVGASAFLVATLGVAAPFALGWGVGAWLLPDASLYVHAFLGATLCATSVGITARVLQDLNRSKTREARVILGAAVIDDVLGLVILAVVSGVIASADLGQEHGAGDVAVILGKAFGFLAAALVLGLYLSPRLFRVASRLRVRGVLLAVALAFCFSLSWLSSYIGLAPIVGAFAAGLILEDVHYRDFRDRGEHTIEELIHPIAGFLVPIFFVLMGMRTDLQAFLQPGVLTLAAALTVAAIAGKQACSLGVLGRGLDRLSVGIGMIPRGEVGLIFANIGLTLSFGGKPIIDQSTFSAVIVMVIVTTMVTPPLLGWSLRRGDARARGTP